MNDSLAPPPAAADPVLDVIQRRWSPVIYSPQPIEPEKLLTILEAARWAPSSRNEQPWSFLVARKDSAEFARMLSCINPGNVTWARNAPVLMISVAKLHFDHNASLNLHAFHDTGIATGFLMLQSAAFGIQVHAMGGFDPVKSRELYDIPLTHEPVAAIALGYPGDEASAPEDLRKRNQRRPRRSLDRFVFEGRCGQASSLL